MKKLLVVYNICGINTILNNRSKLDYYIKCLNGILNQNFDSFDILISSCLSPKDQIDVLLDLFGEKIYFNLIDDRIPVNSSFNYSVDKAVQKLGEYEGYMYIDSGVDISSDNLILEKMYKRLNDRNSMIAGKVTNDMTNYFSIPDINEDYIIPLGKAINLHIQIFSNKFFKEYGNKLMPDIFAGHCSESVLSFMAAAIHTKWILCHDVLADHRLNLDGQSSGFSPLEHVKCGSPTWLHPFIISDEKFYNVFFSKEAQELGLGYEEVRNICFHNKEAFDENGNAKNPKLKEYIKKNLFLQPEDFNYNNLSTTWINP